MPYEFEPNHPDCPPGQGALINKKTGEKVGCHTDEESANEQIAAIESNKYRPMHEANLVGPHGSSLKDLDDKGTFGGLLVRFGGPKEHDLERDFFTKETDFWLKDGEGETATLWAHGTDPQIGKKRIDKGWARLTVKDGGVWMETQLQKRNEYEEAIHQLAEKGKLGLSSGTASHLVEREPTKRGPDGVTHVKTWPLGLDGSATPTPAEPRTDIQPLKNLSFPSLKELSALGGPAGAFGMDGKAENVERIMGQMKAVSWDERIRLIRADFREQFAEMRDVSGPKAIFDNFVVVRGEPDRYYRVPYSGNAQDGYEFPERGEWMEVVSENQFSERSESKGGGDPEIADELKSINEKFFGSRNGPDLTGTEDVASTLESLVQLTT